jgi:hypothetical protein
MEEKYADLWWDAVEDIIQKDIGCFVENMKGMKGCIDTRFLRWKKLCHYLNMSL